MANKTVAWVGFIVSMLALLGLVISMNWASFTETYTTTTEVNFVTVTNRNTTPATVELTAETADKWGTIPGEFDSEYSSTVNLDQFSADFLSVEHMQRTLKKIRESNDDPKTIWTEMLAEVQIGALSYSLTKDQSVSILSSKNKQITYKPDTTFDTSNITLSSLVTTINYDAFSVWYQMENLPSYLKGWQAITQVVNKFAEQDFLSFYYANQMYASYFSNPIWVNAMVLMNYTQEERNAIYYDNFYGMQSIRNLTVWVSATRGN